MVFEVATSVQRRRRWPTAEKIRLVEEATQPGMSVSYCSTSGRCPQFTIQPARFPREAATTFSCQATPL
jgi:hypothetical protein